jgi:hypothetical protein
MIHDTEDHETLMARLYAMTHDELMAWFMEEPAPTPLHLFPLHTDEGRRAFLQEFYDVGRSAIFEAVSHVWASLEEPKEIWCTLMGSASGMGGLGKKALVKLLTKFLDEALAINNPIPPRSDYESLEAWNNAASATWQVDEQELSSLLTKYAQLLNGMKPSSYGSEASTVLPLRGN